MAQVIIAHIDRSAAKELEEILSEGGVNGYRFLGEAVLKSRQYGDIF